MAGAQPQKGGYSAFQPNLLFINFNYAQDGTIADDIGG